MTKIKSKSELQQWLQKLDIIDVTTELIGKNIAEQPKKQICSALITEMNRLVAQKKDVIVVLLTVH